ncbi:DUF4810 domain-containing protein [Trinickia sp. LjRoot230]|uniref:DUF4810 domain-containing protein n=1 Tax=Trinickia sp. LjRoot230 TaxID=3342288 RepID=UPI003ECCA43C
MNYKTMTRGLALPALVATIVLGGCAANQGTEPLYQWTGYQPQVYEYFKGKEAPEAQIEALEKAREQILAKGHATPPGFHAHLGMLYASVGKDELAMQAFSAEKQQFPEATTFMDFLMKKPK